jgi:hypothetical protein
MRSGLAALLMGIGGILLAFGTTVLGIAIFARTGEWRFQLSVMMSVATGALVIGAVMFAVGYLFHRLGRESAGRAAA